MDVNEVTLLGNVGQDPDYHTFDSGDMNAKFSVATSVKWKTGEKTQWHNVVVKDKHLVEVCQKFLQKGTRIWMRGRSETRDWTDKDGNKRYTTEVVIPPFVGQLHVEARGKGWGDAEGGTPQGPTSDPLEDDIPF